MGTHVPEGYKAQQIQAQKQKRLITPVCDFIAKAQYCTSVSFLIMLSILRHGPDIYPPALLFLLLSFSSFLLLSSHSSYHRRRLFFFFFFF